MSELWNKADMDLELGTSYTPELLMNRPILFSPSMLRVISASENYFSRIDERISLSPYQASVQAMLMNLESLASAAIDGSRISLFDLLMSDTDHGKRVYDYDGDLQEANNFDKALRYRRLIKRNTSCDLMKEFHFDRDSIFRLHAELTYPNPEDFVPTYRGQESEAVESLHPKLPQGRTLPPRYIESYMEDLFKFCNTTQYTPQIQASLIHFQLEYIKPFKSNIDALGRHMSYIVYSRRRFTKSIFVPVAITSLARVDNPVDEMKANLSNNPAHRPLELWIYHGSVALMQRAKLIEQILDTLRNIRESWDEQLASSRKGGLCDMIMDTVLSHPIINASYIARISGKSLPAVNAAIQKLVENGILSPLNERKRYRYFYAADIIDYYQQIFDSTLPQGWIPGRELFKS